MQWSGENGRSVGSVEKTRFGMSAEEMPSKPTLATNDISTPSATGTASRAFELVKGRTPDWEKAMIEPKEVAAFKGPF